MKKHILLVTKPGAPDPTGMLAEHPDDFSFLRLDNPSEALRAVREKVPISVLAYDASALGASGIELYKRIAQENDLPTIWLSGEEGEDPEFGSLQPAVIVAGGADRAEFEAAVRRTVRDDFYPPSLVQSLLSACNQVMTATFQRSLEIQEPWLKVSGMVYGDVSACLPFRADKVLGNVIVTGYRVHLAQLGLEIGFEAGEGERRIAQAVVAEISNVIIGRVAMDCGELLGTLRMGLPLVFAGDDLDTHSPEKKPSVCVDVEDDWGKLHTEFLFQRADISAETDKEIAVAGDVLLF
jgi:CheY-specific phosphatase CheX